MRLLYFLEKIRMPVLNEFMLLITQLGEETAFLVAALIVFWCVDKRRGYFLMAVGFLGTMINQFLKLVFRIPRPWVLDQNFSILEQAREAATGYSFPSGHTQSAVGIFGALAVTARRKWAAVLCWTVAFLVGFSRMYIGVPTPYDVLVSAVIALVLMFALRKIARGADMKPVIIIMLLTALGLMLYVHLYPFTADVDEHNLQSGMKNAYTMLGCITGVAMVYVAERKFVNFDTKAVWWAQILKAVLGLGVVLLVKEGLRAPLELALPVYPARAVRYFLIVVAAGLVWPMSFGWFARMGQKRMALPKNALEESNELRNH